MTNYAEAAKSRQRSKQFKERILSENKAMREMLYRCAYLFGQGTYVSPQSTLAADIIAYLLKYGQSASDPETARTHHPETTRADISGGTA